MKFFYSEDVGLLQQVKALMAENNPIAIELLYTYYFSKLSIFACSVLKSKELAEEVVETVFIKLWSNRGRVAQIENLTVYLYKAVKNSALNELKKTSTELPTDFSTIDDYWPAGSISPLEELILSEMMQSMNVAIESLPPRCRMIFKLIREDGLKYKEVAEILNLSINTIDNQMAIAVKRICAALGIKKSSHSTK